MVAFIYLLSGNSNATVGYVEAAFSLATLASTYPVGYLANKCEPRPPPVRARVDVAFGEDRTRRAQAR